MDLSLAPIDNQEKAPAGMKVRCKLCGRWFRRLSVNHLRQHKLNSKSEYKQTVANLERQQQLAKFATPQDVVQELAGMILKGVPVDPELLAKLNEAQRQTAASITGALDVVRVRRLQHLQRLVNGMDSVDEKLYDEKRIAGLTFPDLIRLADYTAKETRETAKDLDDRTRVAGDPSGNGLHVHGNALIVPQTLPPGIPTDPRARSNLVRGVERLLSAQGKDKVDLNGNPDSDVDDTYDDDDE
jgi:hypothetical protein